jgi:UDP-N-acetylglucosamine--N-acetylmuramyl-(pentapeptide) pyrophosphoryl-undecaprenol N-acetylglucosamine transferase
MKVMIAGGGTGGHVFPGLALADRLVKDHGAEVAFIGAPTGVEARLVPEAGYGFHPIEAAPLYREMSLRAARAPFVALRSVRASRPLLVDADVVVGVGGYVSVPPGLACRRAKVPLVLHEQNAVPSLSNRVLARRARSIALTFEDARERFSGSAAIDVTGDPVRTPILEVPLRRDELAAEARLAFDLDEDRTTVVLFGGSQGALHLDECVAGALPMFAGRGSLQLLVITGPEHGGVVTASKAADEDEGVKVRVLPFLERMELAYAVADVAVTRAGATSIAEMTVCGVPMVLVPYPHATENHQEANARELERVGAAEVELDADLTPRALVQRIVEIVDDAGRRARMAEAATRWGKPDADARLAELVAEVAAR